MSDNRDALIVSQNANDAAAKLTLATLQRDPSADPLATFLEIQTVVASNTFDTARGLATNNEHFGGQAEVHHFPTNPGGDNVTCKFSGHDTWDNRDDKRNPKAPDFKCKDKSCGAAAWVNDDGSLYWKAGSAA